MQTSRRACCFCFGLVVFALAGCTRPGPPPEALVRVHVEGPPTTPRQPKEWIRHYGPSASIKAVVRLAGGDRALAGEFRNGSRKLVAFVAREHGDAGFVWKERFEPTNENHESAQALLALAGGDLILATTDMDGDEFRKTRRLRLSRLSPDGASEWHRVLVVPAGLDINEAMLLEAGPGAFFLTADLADAKLQHEQLLAKISNDGSLLWATGLSLAKARVDARRLLPLGDGLVLAGGLSGAHESGLAVAFDPRGAIRWERQYDASITGGVPVAGGFLLSGVLAGAKARVSRLLRIDGAGQLVWQRRLGTDGGGIQGTPELAAIPGGLFLVGNWLPPDYHGSDGWFVQLDEHGDIVRQFSLDGGRYDEFQTFGTENGHLLVAGSSSRTVGDDDSFLFTFDPASKELETADEFRLSKTQATEEPDPGAAARPLQLVVTKLAVRLEPLTLVLQPAPLTVSTQRF